MIKNTRRAALLKLATAGALGSGGILGLVQDALASTRRPVRQGIRSLKGPVTVDGMPAAINQRIRAGQTIVTGPGAEVIYVVGADAFLQHEHSELRYEDSTTVAVLRVITGKILSVFGRGKRDIATPTATIGIRGTGCYIEASPQNTYFCLCYGSAIVTPGTYPAAAETIHTKHHEYPITIGDQPNESVVAAAKVINHTDAELVMLEKLVGRRPPFYGKGKSAYVHV